MRRWPSGSRCTAPSGRRGGGGAGNPPRWGVPGGAPGGRSGGVTVEDPLALRDAVAAAEGTVVVDCLSLWVANLFEAGCADAAVEVEAAEAARVAAGRRTIAVSNEVGLGVVPATPLG